MEVCIEVMGELIQFLVEGGRGRGGNDIHPFQWCIWEQLTHTVDRSVDYYPHSEDSKTFIWEGFKSFIIYCLFNF